jgi:FlaA1/EpsC-like NDP-sugar epimerase
VSVQLSKDALMLLGVDLALVLLAGWASFWLRFNFDIPPEFDRLALLASPWCVVGYAVGLTLARVYRQVWSYIGLAELRQLATGIIFGGVLTAAMVLMLRMPAFPRSVLLLQPLIALLLLGAARAGWRTFTERRTLGQGGRRLVIVGTLQDASDALRALKGSQQWQPVGIVSPAGAEVGRSIQNVRVLGQTSGMTEICEAAQADAALIASPAGSSGRHEALMSAAGSRLTLLTMPRPDEWLKTDSPGPRKIELEDLLGRTAVQLDAAGLAELFSGQTVLVTGAGGSIGSELCRQVARFGVGRLVCVDVSELAIYQLEQELREAHPQMHGCYYTANVREAQRLQAIALKHRPAVVLHAAANKHVPLMEELNEIEALRTNVLGTLHAARAAGESGARRFVMISTDKAVNPTNVMGASKRLAELMVQGAASEYPGTQFVSVRFGNVLGSSGSVVPLFTAQIARGGPVTVTHPDIVRYFMTIPEAAQLVLQAGLMGRSGQIFVLDMGEPVRIAELARMLIRLSGKTEQEIPISYRGLRPGEKLFEELLADDETTEPTPHPKLRIAKTSSAMPDIAAVMRWIEEAGPAPAGDCLRQWLRTQVPEYAPR